MQKALEILFHIDELYTEKPDRAKIERLAENNPEKIQAWEDAFAKYDLSDILNAIDNFWEYKSSKSKPNVAQIKAILSARNVETFECSDTALPVPLGSCGLEKMREDVATGNCRNNVYVYLDAEKIILNDWLSREMPASLWAKMGYSDRVKQAKAKGLFDNFDKALIQAAQARFGRDCEFQSLNDMKGVDSFRYDGKDAVSTLAAHWGID